MGVGVFIYSPSAPAQNVPFPTSMVELHSEVVNRYGLTQGKGGAGALLRLHSQQELDTTALCHYVQLQL